MINQKKKIGKKWAKSLIDNNIFTIKNDYFEMFEKY